MNPFLVFDLPITCTDDQVRDRYHELIRRYPPEGNPERFQLIQEAAAVLRTEAARQRWLWLNIAPAAENPAAAVEAFARLPGRSRPPGLAALQALLRSAQRAACQAAQKQHS